MPAHLEVIDVVVRCRNEMPHTRRTLLGLAEQVGPRARILFIDCASTDGSREAAVDQGVEIVDRDPATYVPGAVLNFGLRRTTSPIVAFINADAVPLRPDALALLVAPLLADPTVAATFGRQLAREDADDLTKLDHQRAYGPEKTAELRRGSFFSMAASAVRRDVWEKLSFDDRLPFSEDVDWTHRLCFLGYRTLYVPAALFEHSHAYTLQGLYKRQRGEGAAFSAIFRLPPPSPVTELARPLAGTLVRDLRAGVISPRAVRFRFAQAVGYFAGRSHRIPGGVEPGTFALPSWPPPGGVPRARPEDVPEAARAAITRIESAAGEPLLAVLLVGPWATGEAVAEVDRPRLLVLSGGREEPLASRLRDAAGPGAEVTTVGQRDRRLLPPTLDGLDASLGALRVVTGSPAPLALLTRVPARKVSLDEAARRWQVALRRLAQARLSGGDATAALRAAILAAGDALLLAVDRYALTRAARADELTRLQGAPGVAADLGTLYRQAFAPSRPSWSLADRLPALTLAYLGFEAVRRGTPRELRTFCGEVDGQSREERATRAAAALALEADEREARRLAAIALGAGNPLDDAALRSRIEVAGA